MRKSTDTPKHKRTRPHYPIELYLREMPGEMKEYRFPCGEEECPEESAYELHIEMWMGGGDYTMPICFEHWAMAGVWIQKLYVALDDYSKKIDKE